MPRHAQSDREEDRLTRIAVVDDDRQFLDLLAALFHERGWGVVTCLEPRRAVDDIRVARPDVVILDILMGPVYSGWKVLQLLKQEVLTRDIPVILCSGAPELDDKEAWLHERGIATIKKPFEIDVLYRMVEAMLTEEQQART
jgi:DNA-binding response OmpR family regulator